MDTSHVLILSDCGARWKKERASELVCNILSASQHDRPPKNALLESQQDSVLIDNRDDKKNQHRRHRAAESTILKGNVDEMFDVIDSNQDGVLDRQEWALAQGMLFYFYSNLSSPFVSFKGCILTYVAYRAIESFCDFFEL